MSEIDEMLNELYRIRAEVDQVQASIDTARTQFGHDEEMRQRLDRHQKRVDMQKDTLRETIALIRQYSE